MKFLLCEYEDLNLIPRTHTKQSWMCQCSFIILELERQGQVVSYGSPASQPSPLGELQRPCLMKHDGLLLRNNNQGCPLVSTSICTHTSIHLHTPVIVYIDTHAYIINNNCICILVLPGQILGECSHS